MDLRAYIDSFPEQEREAERKRLAIAAGVTAGAVRHWANGIREVPGPKVNAVSDETDGRVLPHELRPDIFRDPSKHPRRRKAGARIGARNVG